MAPLKDTVFFNGTKLSKFCDSGDLVAMPPRVSTKSACDIPYFEMGGCFPMPGVKVFRQEKVEIVRQCVIVLLGGMTEEAPVEYIHVNTVDGSTFRMHKANGTN